jgi:proline dehydrogenase
MGKRNCPYGHFPANIVDQLLLRGHPCSIATNHQKMQRATSSLVARYRSGRDQYEFESLYGN